MVAIPACNAGRSQLAPTSGAMGYGVPAAVAAALERKNSTLLHLMLDVDVSTSRSTLSAIRTLAQRGPTR